MCGAIDRHGKDGAHRGAHRFDRVRVTRVPNKDHAASGTGVGAANGTPEVARITWCLEHQPACSSSRVDARHRLRLGGRVGIDGELLLRVVAPGDLCQHLGRHRERLASATRSAVDRGAKWSSGQQHFGDPACCRRGRNGALALGQEEALLVAALRCAQGAQPLHDRVGEALNAQRLHGGRIPLGGGDGFANHAQQGVTPSRILR